MKHLKQKIKKLSMQSDQILNQQSSMEETVQIFSY